MTDVRNAPDPYRGGLKCPLVRWAALCALPLIGVLPAFLVWAAVSHSITQKDRQFAVSAITIAAGDSLLFTNEDPFLHQIYVNSPRLNFESDEQPPGKTIAVHFPDRGTFEVRCHIHPKMSLAVTVE